MMKLINWIKSHKILVAGSLIIIAIVLFLSFQQERQKQNTLTQLPETLIRPQDPNLESFFIADPEFVANLSFPTLPANLPIFNYNNQGEYFDQVAAHIASVFSLQKGASPGVWQKADSSEFLTVDQDGNKVTYQVNGFVRPSAFEGPKNPTKDMAIQSAKAFAASFNTWKGFEVEESNIKYLNAASGELEEVLQEEPHNLITIPFSPKIEGQVTRYQDEIFAPLEIIIGQENKVVKLQAIPVYIEKDTLNPVFKNARTISKQDAQKFIKEGKGVVVNVSSQFPTVENINSLQRLDINKASLEYRLTFPLRLIIPYLRFTGIATVEGNNNIRVEILLPAIYQNDLGI